MKISKDFIMREVAGEVIVVPTGAAASRMNGLITLNEVAAFLWKNLKEEHTEEELTRMVLAEYEVDVETAGEDVRKFIEALGHLGMLEE